MALTGGIWEMAYPREFSVVLFLFLVLLSAYFLLLGRLGTPGFVGSVIASAFAVA